LTSPHAFLALSLLSQERETERARRKPVDEREVLGIEELLWKRGRRVPRERRRRGWESGRNSLSHLL